MINQAKNLFYLTNPLILQNSLFRGLIFCTPLVLDNTDTVLDLVRRNGLATLEGGMVRSHNEYGPAVIPADEDYILTGCPTSKITMQDFTLMMWAATEDTSEDKIYAMGFYKDGDLSCELGRRSNNPACVVKSLVGYTNINGTASGHNDGNTHMFCASSNVDALKIYYEGREVATGASVDDEIGDVATYFRVGFTTNVAWDGTICFAAAWNRGLTPTEVYELYRMGPALMLPVGDFDIGFRAAVSQGIPPFNAAWALNSNQVL